MRKLLFARSSLAFGDHHDGEDWWFLRDNHYDAEASSTDTIVAVVAQGAEALLESPISDRPEWLDFIEVLAVGSDVVCEEDIAERERREFYKDHSDETESEALTRALRKPGFEVPTFGRKLLCLWYSEDASDANIAHHAADISKRLSSAGTVWHGRHFRGIAFRDARKSAVISVSRGCYEPVAS